LALLTAALFLATTTDLVFLARPAAADAREDLTRAEDYFLVADFSTALQKVEALLQTGDLQGSTLRDAWILKARCEIGLGHRSTATDAFCEALRVEPSWRPDPDLYTNDELEVFEQARSSCGGGTGEPVKQESAPSTTRTEPAMPQMSSGEKKPWYKKPVFLAIGGALVVGGIIAAAGGGGGDDGEPDLPGFPDPPQ